MSTYVSPTDVSAATLIRSATINDLDAAVGNAFALLPTETHLNRGTTQYAVDTGVVNAYLVSLPYAPSGYVDGLRVTFRSLNTNTGASTINVNGLGVKSIRLTSGADTAAGDITAGSPLEIFYSTATGFFHIGPSSATSSINAAIVTERTAVATLTNKTLTTPVVNGLTGSTDIWNIGSGQIYKDASGNLCIGATAAGFGSGLYLRRTSGSAKIAVYADSAAEAVLSLLNQNNNVAIGNGTGGELVFYANTATTERVRIDSSGNVKITNTTGAPGTPTAGGILYVQAGALKYIGSSGTITTLAAA